MFAPRIYRGAARSLRALSHWSRNGWSRTSVPVGVQVVDNHRWWCCHICAEHSRFLCLPPHILVLWQATGVMFWLQLIAGPYLRFLQPCCVPSTAVAGSPSRYESTRASLYQGSSNSQRRVVHLGANWCSQYIPTICLGRSNSWSGNHTLR